MASQRNGGDEDGAAYVAAMALDLLGHAGWEEVVLAEVRRKAAQVRAELFAPGTDLTATEKCRGALDALKVVVTMVYRTAHKDVPAEVAALFS